MKNVFITGGAGFIGSNFIHFLQKVEPDVNIVNLDKLTYSGSLENLKNLPEPNRHEFIEGDICDSELITDIFERYHIDTIVHFAAETHVDRSIVDPQPFVQTNIVGTFTLLEAARKYWITDKSIPIEQTRFHHISTDEVYGTLGLHEPAWTEETSYEPNSPYSATKASSDHLVRSFGHTYGLRYSITNCTNNYGPHQFPEKLIPLMIMNAVNGKPLPLYGDGKQIRDWLYVEDHCEAIWMVIKKGAAGETYNIGGGSQPTNKMIVNQICGILDETLTTSSNVPHSSLITHVPDRPGHDRRYAIDISKINRDLGWQPRFTLGKGLASTIQWYLDNPTWLETIQSQQDYQDWLSENYMRRENTKS